MRTVISGPPLLICAEEREDGAPMRSLPALMTLSQTATLPTRSAPAAWVVLLFDDIPTVSFLC